MPRIRLTLQAVLDQVDILSKLGFGHIELSSGDDIVFLKNNVYEIVEAAKKKFLSTNPKGRLSLCTTPLQESSYKCLQDHGLDTILTWQETYNRDVFNRLIPSGPKAFGVDEAFNLVRGGDGFMTRLQSQEFAIRSGLQAGIGCMLGLSSRPATDILSVIVHGNKLISHYSDICQPIIIGMPTWNPITTSETDNKVEDSSHFDPEKEFELISAIYLLSFPDRSAWIFTNCRVSLPTQVASAATAGCFSSTMVNLAPGGYLPESTISDPRIIVDKCSGPVADLDGSKFQLSEQFCHHFHEHFKYVEAFKDSGLKIVGDDSLLRDWKK